MFGSIVKFFLENKALSWLVIVFIIVSGGFGFFGMPQQYNPEVTLPAFMIQTQFAGATAEEVQEFVTDELEEKLAEIKGVDTISSQSFEGGLSVVRVEFLVGEDLEKSKVKVFSKINENLDLAKNPNISAPLIKTISPDDVAVGVWALTSNVFSENVLREKAIRMSKELQKIEGVANVMVTGGERKALKIIVDPEKLKSQNLSLDEVATALKMNNGRAIVGNLRTDKFLHEIEVDTNIRSAEEAKNIVIGNGITLGDIATVMEAYTEKTSYVQLYHQNHIRNQEAVYISIAKRKGENTSDVMDRAFNKIKALSEKQENADITITNIRNTAKIANDAIFGLGTNLIQSIVIVMLVLMVFLGGRAASLVAIAIPLSLFMVFFVGLMGEQTINKVTLFALILSLGLLVDSATVVVENIYRNIQMQDGRTKFQKIADAVQEVGVGLLLSTLTSVIVFLPLTQISGMMGAYMGPLAFFVPAALVCSLLVAYIITPFLSQFFFKCDEKQKKKDVVPEKVILTSGEQLPSVDAIQKKPSDTKEQGFEKFQNWYGRKIKNILESTRKQKLIIYTVFLAMFGVFIFIPLKLVHFQMLPKADNKTLWVTIDKQEGSSSDATQDLALQVQNAIAKLDDIESIMLFTGTSPIVDFNGLFRGFSGRTGEHQSSLLVSFTDDKEKTSEEKAEEIRSTIAPFRVSGNATIRVVEDPPGPPVFSTLVVRVISNSTQARENIRKVVEKILYTTDGVVDIDSSHQHLYPRSTLVVDYKKAKLNNVSAYSIYKALDLAVTPSIISRFSTDHATEQSVIEFSIPKEKREQLGDIQKIAVKNRLGQMVPLSAVTKEIKTHSAQVLLKNDHRAESELYAEMESRSVVYAMIDVMFALYDDIYSDRISIENFSLYGIDLKDKQTGEMVRLEWGGEFEMTLDNFRDLLIALSVAFALVYAILVGQFRSFMIPLLIMATVPLAFLGILPGFAVLDALNGTFLTATALIGFIALLGIVVNNAIIYLEYLEILRSKGYSIKDALIETGKTRLRPILLTSMTTVLGSLTIAGDPVWSGLAWSIVFGLSFSAILTLGIFPILYYRTQKEIWER